MLNKRIYITFLFLLVLVSFFKTQTSSNEAVDNLNISSITKDQYGRIWIGTFSGLKCYDGSQLIEFNSKQYQDLFPDGGIIGVVFNPAQKKLVITTKKGVVFFDPDNYKSKLLSLSDLKIKNLKNGIWFPCIDEEGNTWCSDNEGGLIKIDKYLNSKILRFKLPINSDLLYTYGNYNGFSSVSCSNGNIYFGTRRSEVCRFNVSSNKVSVVSNDHRAINGIYHYGGDLVFSDFDGLNFKRESDTSIKSHIPAHLISFLYKDDNNELWYVLNKTQLFKLNENKKPELVYELSTEQINKHKIIRAILVDKDRVWLATERGLLIINKPLKAFYKIFDKLPGYSNMELSSRGIVAKDDSIIICAGYNYLASYNKRSNEIKSLIDKESSKEIIPYGLCITGDSLWIGSEGGGLGIFSFKALKLKRPEFSNKVPPKYFVYGGLIRCVTKVDSFIYLGEYGIFGLYNLKTKKVIDSYSPEWPSKWAREKTNNINQILKLNNNELLFVATGIIVITNKQFSITNIIKPENLHGGTKDFLILNVMLDTENNFWISTDRAGLCLYNRKTKKCKWFNTQNGLCDNTVYYCLQSQDNRVWVATNFGLSVIDVENNRINNFFEEDGIVNNEFNSNSYYKANNGDLYFGGMKGVTRIIPSLLKLNSSNDHLILSSIYMTGFKNNDSLYLSGLNKIKNIVLPYHSRFIKVTFSLLNYSNKNKYEFRLLGIDSAWLSLGNTNTVMFNSLEPGNYTLQIRAWNERGELNPEVITLSILAEQVFYLQLWFIVSSAIIITILIGFIFYIVYRTKIKGLHKMADMRLKIATDLHDQVGGLLNKTATQADIAKMRLKQEDGSLTKIADNSRVALNSMRDILWNLDPRNDNPESLVVRMSEYAQKMLDDTNYYELNLAILKEVELSHEIRQVINTVFKESINNIVKHASNERVLVKVEKTAVGLVLSVYNSGKFVSKNEFSGQGLRNMKMRIEKIGGEFKIEHDEGVLVIFKIPIK